MINRVASDLWRASPAPERQAGQAGGQARHTGLFLARCNVIHVMLCCMTLGVKVVLVVFSCATLVWVV